MLDSLSVDLHYHHLRFYGACVSILLVSLFSAVVLFVKTLAFVVSYYTPMCFLALQRTYWNVTVIDFIAIWTLPYFMNPFLPPISPSHFWKIYTQSFFLKHLSFSIILVVLTCLTPRPLSPFTKWRRGSSHQI